ncbi:MAG: Fumarate hydratase class II, partial [uncultured Sphingomonas sp.]
DRHPHRDRQLRPHRSSRRPILGGADRAVDREFPVRPARGDAGRDRPCAGICEAGGGAGERADRRARPEPRGGDRTGGGGGRGRRHGRSVPARHLADGIGHADQHERQRGDRGPRQRGAGGNAGGKDACPPERPRQHGAIVQRQLPDRAARRGGDRGARPASARAADRPRAAGRAGRGMGPHHQDRAHAPPGRDAADAGAGVLRLRAADRGRDRPGGGRAAEAAPAGAGRHRGRDGAQRAQGIRRGVRGGDREPHPHPLRHRAQQVRGAGEPRHAGRTVGGSQHARRVANQDRQRHPAAGLRPALRSRRAPAAGKRAGVVDHAGQGQPDAGRDADHGRGAGDGEPCRGDRRRAAGSYGAERLQAADRGERHPIDRASQRRVRELHGTRAGRAEAGRGADRRPHEPIADAGHRPRARDRLRQRRGDRQGRAQAGADAQGGGGRVRADRRGDVRPGGAAGGAAGAL